MRPFQQLRLWLRSGPPAERGAAGVAALLALSLLVWTVVPGGSDSADELVEASGAPADGALAQVPGTEQAPVAGAAGTAGTAPAPGAAGVPSGTTPGTSGTSGTAPGSAPAGGTAAGAGPAGAPGGGSGVPGTAGGPAPRACPVGATDQGVTGNQVTVGVIVPDLGAANETIGLPSREDAEKAYNAVIADYNDNGGLACRKVVARYYSANPVDASSEHAACLAIQEDKVFAVLNNVFNAQELSCIPQAKIPNFWYTPPATSLARKYSPYILSYQPDYERLIRYYIRGAKEVGWFKDANKIGILESTCVSENIDVIKRELTRAGFPSSSWSTYSYGCPANGIGTSDKQTAAVLQFKRDGVTHVVSVAYAQSTQMSRAADQQDYKPKWAIMDDAQVSATDRASTTAGRSFDGALAITPSQSGAENTPDTRFSAATERCRALMKKAGLIDPVDPLSGNAGPLNGGACAQMALFAAAVSNAPELTRRALASGLSRAGQLDLSFPAGPAAVTDARVPTGGNFWRTLAYKHSCNCWLVTSSPWRKGFQP